MHSSTDSLSALAARAGRGDSEALTELRQQLGLHLPRIVRWALGVDAGSSVLAHRIRAVACSLAGDATNREMDPDQLVGQAARSIGQLVDQRLRARAAPGQGLKDTVPS